MEKIFIYDTTLRDGEQGEGVEFSAEEKIQVAMELDKLGVDYIEGGWPGSNAKDRKFFKLIQEKSLKNAKIVAFTSTRKAKIKVEEDENLKAVLDSGVKVVAVFGKSWDKHTKLMNISMKENLAMIRESVSFFRKKGFEVIYDAEHFFDGYKENPEYALKTLQAADEGGADFLTLCETNGGCLYFEIEEIVGEVISFFGNQIKIGIHTHNDSASAVTNSVAAVRKGAELVQGTVNGYGERSGNADLTSLIPILQLKMGYDCLGEKIKKITHTSRVISEIANMTPYKGRPFVGESVFAHKGGVHVNLVQKDPSSYEHMNPDLVGNRRRVLISDLGGKSNIRHKAKEMGIELDENDLAAVAILVKEKEGEGFKYEAADASLALLIKGQTGEIEYPFELESFDVHIHKEKGKSCVSQATVKISSNGESILKVAEGGGPVNALSEAFLKALGKQHHRSIKDTRLSNFKVRVVNGGGTDARVRVLSQFRDGDHIWNTVGCSEDIIEASWQSFWDGIMAKMLKI